MSRTRGEKEGAPLRPAREKVGHPRLPHSPGRCVFAAECCAASATDSLIPLGGTPADYHDRPLININRRSSSKNLANARQESPLQANVKSISHGHELFAAA